MWCRVEEEGRTWQLGVRFVDLPRRAAAEIERYLEYLRQVEKDWVEGRFPIR